jgi:hypothetical protein
MNKYKAHSNLNGARNTALQKITRHRGQGRSRRKRKRMKDQKELFDNNFEEPKRRVETRGRKTS